MGWIKKIVVLLILVCGLVLGVWFSTENTQPLSIVLLGFPMPAVSSGVLICGVLLAGAIVGYLVSLVAGLKTRNDNLSLKRKLNRLDKELERLRKAPVKG